MTPVIVNPEPESHNLVLAWRWFHAWAERHPDVVGWSVLALVAVGLAVMIAMMPH